MSLQPAVVPVGPRFDRFRRDGQWDGSVLGDALEAHVDARPDALAIIDRFGSLTYRELEEAVGRCAATLVANGVEAGDVVSLQIPNRREFIIVHLAAERIGAITNPLLTQYREHELGGMQLQVKAKVAVFSKSYRGHDFSAMWRNVQESTGFPSALIEIEEHATDDALFAAGYLSMADVPRPDGEDLNIVLFTSGTVRSKGVLHTHNTTLYGLREYAKWMHLDPSMVLWMPSPISHATGLQWGVRTSVYAGGTIVLQEHWNAVEAIDLVKRTGATHTIGATAFIHDLRLVARGREADLASLQYFVCAGAPIPEEIADAVQRELGFEFIRAYGMSEHFISTICHPTDPLEKRLVTDGRCLPGTEIAIFDDERSEQLGVGEEGELAIRGPGVALGYLNEPEETSRTWTADGWQFSGDVAAIDEAGFVKLLGRKKDLIIRGGLNISAQEVESLLFLHSDIEDVALIGIPDERLGEKICAVIVPVAGSSPTLDDLTRHLMGLGVSKMKLPEIIELRTMLPKTASGKIRKNILREEMERKA
jgi:acyl-CoA synthetase (AMP-forming)/AMP-acid ligase II